MVSECQHVLPGGKKCRAIALRGKTLCPPSRPQLQAASPAALCRAADQPPRSASRDHEPPGTAIRTLPNHSGTRQ